MANLTFAIITLGCKVNQCDSNILINGLTEAGYSLVDKQADIAVVNSCSVTQAAIRKSRKAINRARLNNPEAKIILSGCWPRAYRVKAKKTGAKYVWYPNDIDGLAKYIDKIVKKKASCTPLLAPVNKESAKRKSRYYLKIQDGCEQYCTYCIVPYTRGKSRSRQEADILREVKQAISYGYNEIVLSGIHLGHYGRDISTDLYSLLVGLVVLPGLGRLRLSSIEITEIDNRLVGLIRESKKICNHLHIPLQSGSDKILKLMNRHYDRRFFRDRLKYIKEQIPDIAITTDVIVGFPGENEDDYSLTCELTKEIRFSRLHVFPFSIHDKTPAAKLPGRNSSQTISYRATKLRQLSYKLNTIYKRSLRGCMLGILIERDCNGYLIGKTEHYTNIKFLPSQIISQNAVITDPLDKYRGKLLTIKN